MHSPTTVVYWEVWKRHRWLLIGSILWLLALSSLPYLLASGWVFGEDFSKDSNASLFIRLLAIGPFVVGLIPLFVYAVGADLASRDSNFPTRLFTLPLTNHDLVGWPMLYGTATIALTWISLALFLLRPFGWEAPLLWPAVLLASCLAWIQTISWRPFGLPWLRIVTAVLPVGLIAVLSSLCWMLHFPEAYVSLLLAATVLIAYRVAVSGVAHARCGDVPDRQRLIDTIMKIADRCSLRGRRFRSDSGAQVWYEWRRNGLGLLLLVGLMVLFLGALILLVRQNPALSPHAPIRSPLVLLVVPLFAATISGGSWGNCGNPRRGMAISAFLATRPMSCTDLVWSKMKTAAISVAIIWVITLSVVMLMTFLTGARGEIVEQWNMYTGQFSTVQKTSMLLLVAALLPIATWRPMLVSMFIGLTGRSWIWTVGAIVMSGMVVMIIPCACWIVENPTSIDTLKAAMPGVIGLLATIKLLFGIFLIRALIQKRLIQTQLIERILVVWLLSTVTVSLLFCGLILQSFEPWPLVVAGIILFLPLVRISLAPLALAWNRHR